MGSIGFVHLSRPVVSSGFGKSSGWQQANQHHQCQNRRKNAMRLSDLQSKNIVNMVDGRNVGSIIDANVDKAGNIESLVIETNKKFLSFSKDDDLLVLWKDIAKIGEDVILINLKM